MGDIEGQNEEIEPVIKAMDMIAQSDSALQTIEKTDPDKAIKALNYLSAGKTKAWVAKELAVSPNTITALTQRQPEVIAILRKRAQIKAAVVSDKFFELAALMVQERIDNPELRDKIPLKDVAIGQGIYVDKSQLLNSQPTSITETRNEPSISDAQELIRKAKARIIDIPPLLEDE